MRSIGLLLAVPAVLATGCGDPPAGHAETSFATWLAGLPAPESSDSFSCTYAVSGELEFMGSRTGLRAGGMLASNPEGKMRLDFDLEVEPPDVLPGQGSSGFGSFRVGSKMIFDGEQAWLELRTDLDMLSGLAAEQGFDLDQTVMTLRATTIERVLASLVTFLTEDPAFAAVRQELSLDGEIEAGTLGPAFWVHMVGRESEVLSFRQGDSSVEVAFGLDVGDLADVSVMPRLEMQPRPEQPEQAGIPVDVTLRMIFDLETGFTKAIRLELSADDNGNSTYVRLDVGKISAEVPDAELFRYTETGRRPMPLDALAEPLLQQLPQEADGDIDF